MINELTGAQDPKNRVQTEGDKALLQQVMQEFPGIERITREASANNPNLAEKEFTDKMGQKGKDAIQWLRTQRAGGDASKASQNYNRSGDRYTAEGSGETMNREVKSDARIKNIVRTISSFRY